MTETTITIKSASFSRKGRSVQPGWAWKISHAGVEQESKTAVRDIDFAVQQAVGAYVSIVHDMRTKARRARAKATKNDKGVVE